MVGRMIGLIALAGIAAASSGCLIVRGSSVDESGTKISSPTLNQIKPGETTEACLVATAGEPTRRSAVNEKTSILRYDHTVTTQKGGAVFLLFAGGDQKEERTSTIFEVVDGVVTRYWVEGASSQPLAS
jgi:hypothetical protein